MYALGRDAGAAAGCGACIGQQLAVCLAQWLQQRRAGFVAV